MGKREPWEEERKRTLDERCESLVRCDAFRGSTNDLLRARTRVSGDGVRSRKATNDLVREVDVEVRLVDNLLPNCESSGR